MAIKKPTPPTPPTAPISPKGDEDASSTDTGDSSGTANEVGARDFGVHITISSPEDKGNSQQNSEKKETTAPTAGTDQSGNTSVTGEAAPVQAVPVQTTETNQQLTTQVQEDGQKIHIANNDSMGGHISIWPFVLIFIMAFLGFTFLNMRKNKQLRHAMKTEKKENLKGSMLKENQRVASKKDDDSHGHFEIRV